MKKIELTQGYFASVDNSDYEWLSEFNWYYRTDGYAGNKALGTMHRTIMEMLQGPLQRCNEVHHRDENRLNNQRKNLIVIPKSLHNLLRSSKGVANHGTVRNLAKPFEACIKLNGIRYSLGCFSSEKEAQDYYNKTKIRIIQSYGNLQ